MDKREHRLRRQFEAIERGAPIGGTLLRKLREKPLRMVRIPLAVLLIIGGLLGFLPVLGFWMAPLGLLLLAIDIPALSPVVAAAVIRIRRRVVLWQRRWRRRRRE